MLRIARELICHQSDTRTDSAFIFDIKLRMDRARENILHHATLSPIFMFYLRQFFPSLREYLFLINYGIHLKQLLHKYPIYYGICRNQL